MVGDVVDVPGVTTETEYRVVVSPVNPRSDAGGVTANIAINRAWNPSSDTNNVVASGVPYPFSNPTSFIEVTQDKAGGTLTYESITARDTT